MKILKEIQLLISQANFMSIQHRFQQILGKQSVITGDGKTYVTGYNSDFRISGSLPQAILPTDTELFLSNSEGQPYKFISVVCGVLYTLYLVSSESYFKLVYCYANRTPNPLFVNIGNRTPRALFGGNSTSGVIDTEGGIIILTESVFFSPKKRVEASFLPDGDKPVKLVCCEKFVISLGASGRVYVSEISSESMNKFEEVEELSDLKVVDISGTYDFCFAVLKDGRVFGYGENSHCKLGFPEEISSVSKFTLIESLKKYKIVSVFTGTYHSIFKTSENKMIACGSNKNGQLFIQINDKEIVYPPEEIQKCRKFTFCVTGSLSSTVFFDIETPPNFSNKKIEDKEREIVELKRIILEKEEEISKLKKGNKENENLLKKKEEENSKLKQRNKEYEERLKTTEEELMQLKNKIKKQSMNEFQILDADTIKGLENIEEISSNNNSKIMKVAKKIIYV